MVLRRMHTFGGDKYVEGILTMRRESSDEFFQPFDFGSFLCKFQVFLFYFPDVVVLRVIASVT